LAISVTTTPAGEQIDDIPAMAPIAVPRKLAEDAADALRERILAGDLKFGTHLVEAKLASRLGVSRGTVREAIKILVADGLVREEARRGAHVVPLSARDVQEIYDVRSAVEGRAARILAERRDPATIGALAESVAVITRAAADGDLVALRRGDLAFHTRICELSGNARLVEIFNRYVPIIQSLLAYDQTAYSSLSDIVREHLVIFESIRDGDAVRAAAEVEGHCDRSAETVAAHFSADPAG